MKRVGAPPVTHLYAIDERWSQAACLGLGDLFHPDGYTSAANQQQIAQARAVCARCPLTGPAGPCLKAALDEERGLHVTRRHGIRAGTTPAERAAMSRRNAA